jgi:hypothetical protein
MGRTTLAEFYRTDTQSIAHGQWRVLTQMLLQNTVSAFQIAQGIRGKALRTGAIIRGKPLKRVAAQKLRHQPPLAQNLIEKENRTAPCCYTCICHDLDSRLGLVLVDRWRISTGISQRNPPMTDTSKDMPEAAKRALAEAEERREAAKKMDMPKELGGRKGPEPVRYGDWENKGIAIDF